jgi:small subunit ribosomal protein S8
MVTDPIGDFIIQLKNASISKKDVVVIPYSKFKFEVAEVLKKIGYLKSVNKKGKKVQKTIEIEMLYDKDNKSPIHGVQRVSKPGNRSYCAFKDINPVKYGKGSLILSSPKGVLTDGDARRERVGGEALFKIW